MPARVRRPDRRGMSLIEVVQMLTIVGLLTSLSMTVLATSFRVHRSVLQRYRELESVERFARIWRQDLQAATAVRLTPTGVDGSTKARGQRLELVRAVGDQSSVQIVYTVENGSIVRTKTEVEETLPEQRWELPAEGQLWFSTLPTITERVAIVAELEFASTRRSSTQQWVAICSCSSIDSQLKDSP